MKNNQSLLPQLQILSAMDILPSQNQNVSYFFFFLRHVYQKMTLFFDETKEMEDNCQGYFNRYLTKNHKLLYEHN